jgi:hypothetical protein
LTTLNVLFLEPKDPPPNIMIRQRVHTRQLALAWAPAWLVDSFRFKRAAVKECEESFSSKLLPNERYSQPEVL